MSLFVLFSTKCCFAKSFLVINPSMPSELFFLNSLDRFISYIGCLVSFLSPYSVGISELNANRLDPDQTPPSAASDQDLRCLSMFLLWNARNKELNPYMVIWEVDKMKTKSLVLEIKQHRHLTFIFYQLHDYAHSRNKHIQS